MLCLCRVKGIFKRAGRFVRGGFYVFAGLSLINGATSLMQTYASMQARRRPSLWGPFAAPGLYAGWNLGRAACLCHCTAQQQQPPQHSSSSRAHARRQLCSPGAGAVGSACLLAGKKMPHIATHSHAHPFTRVQDYLTLPEEFWLDVDLERHR